MTTLNTTELAKISPEKPKNIKKDNRIYKKEDSSN